MVTTKRKSKTAKLISPGATHKIALLTDTAKHTKSTAVDVFHVLLFFLVLMPHHIYERLPPTKTVSDDVE